MPSNAINLFLTKFRMPSEPPKLEPFPSAILVLRELVQFFCPRIKQNDQDLRKIYVNLGHLSKRS